MKFYFRATEISVSMPDLDVAGKLVLVWKRGPRRTMTEPFDVKETLSSVDGTLSRTASTTQDLALICTMFKNVRSGAFESKSSAFSLREETPEGVERKLGSASIDLSSYATPDKHSDAVELSFMEGKVRLKLTLTSHWLKQMTAVDDDDASVSSVGSFASSAMGGAHSDDDFDDVPTSSRHAAHLGHHRSAAPGHAVPPPSASAAAAAMTPGASGATERERAEAARVAAAERRWVEEANRATLNDEAEQEAEQLQAELSQAREALASTKTETKYLKGRVERLVHENRVLRREQRGGNRDEVVLQLETELVAKESERAEMEEQLSKAFGGVISDAHARIGQLTAERDRLLVSLEEHTKHKKGFLHGK